MDQKIKLLVCYHKPDVLLKDDILVPIHVGRALARKKAVEGDKNFQWMTENMIGDDTGDNISEKNGSYNELTAMYWAWKNYDVLGDPDYIGLMHYRRHFIFRPAKKVVEEVDGIDENYFKRLNYSSETMRHLFDDCDFAAHVGRVSNIYEHYKRNHHIEDLEKALTILYERYPQYRKSAKKYLGMSYGNFCNMFIFPREIFFDYCAWLFDILAEFERQTDLSEKRLFISERLTGIYIERLKSCGLKQKSLSATFVRAPMRAAVAIPYKQECVFRTAVTMTSVLETAAPDVGIDFYVLCCNARGAIEDRPFAPLEKRYKNCSIRYVDISETFRNEGEETAAEASVKYPVGAVGTLDKVGKALYLDENVVCTGDIGEVLQLCNTDEFAVIGIPEDNKYSENIFVMNCGRLRAHGVSEQYSPFDSQKSSADYFMRIMGAQNIGAMPDFMYTKINLSGQEIAEQRLQPLHSLVCYTEDSLPWNNVLAPFAQVWWDAAKKVPAGIKFDCVAAADASARFLESTQELCERFGKKLVDAKEKISAEEDLSARSDGLLAKGISYFHRNGLKMTVRKTAAILFGRTRNDE